MVDRSREAMEEKKTFVSTQCGRCKIFITFGFETLLVLKRIPSCFVWFQTFPRGRVKIISVQ